MPFCDGGEIYSGKREDGTGSSDEPGCAADGGSDASIDSSLPTSTLALRSFGSRLSLRSSSRSGGADMTGGGVVFRSSFTSASPCPTIARVKRGDCATVPPILAPCFDGPRRNFCQRASGGLLPGRFET